MKKSKTISFIFFLMLSLMLCAETGIKKEIFRVSSTQNSTEILFKMPDFETSNESQLNKNFKRFKIDQAEFTTKEGLPELPFFTVSIAVPVNSSISLLSKNTLASEIINNITVYPSQGDEDERKAFEFNEEYYEKKQSNLQESVVISDIQIIRDFAFISVNIYPMNYNPGERKIEISKEMSIRIAHEARGNAQYQVNETISRAFEPFYRATFANYDQIRSDYPVYQQPSILIIHPTNTQTTFTTELNKLVNWKKQKGFFVSTADASVTGTTTTDIKNYIQTAYNTWADKPEYIIIIGDASAGTGFQVSTFNIAYGSFAHYGGAGDYPYTFLSGDDFYGDVIIGRMSISSIADFQTMVAKVMFYERFPTSEGTEWMNENLLVGDTTPSGYSTVIMNKYVKELKESYDPAHNYLELYGGDPSPTTMQNKVSSGVLTFNYRGYIGMSGFSETLVNGLTNIKKLTNAVFLTCSTGPFASSSIIETITRAGTAAEPKGAITSVGLSTSGTHTTYNNCIMGGLFHAMYRENITTMGGAMLYSKHYIHRVYGTTQTDAAKTFSQWMNLMGDPTVNIYRTIAKTLNVNYPATVSVGTNYITVIVRDSNNQPVKDAWVSLTQNNNRIDFKVSPVNGVVILAIPNELSSNLTLVVSHPDFAAKMFTIQADTNASIAMNAYTITDTPNGNNNQQINPGETIRLSTNIKNYTSTAYNNINLKLRSSNPYITISDSTASIASISAGSTVNLNNEFAFTVNGAYPNNFPLELNIVMSTGANTWQSIIIEQVKAIDLDVVSVISNGAGGIIPIASPVNIYTNIINNGAISASNINGILRSKSVYLQVSDSLGTYGTINAGSSGNNQSNTYTIQVLNGAYPGSQVKAELYFYNALGYEETEEIILTVGSIATSDPTPPDAYGYAIYDETDVTYSQVPVYNWVEINTIGTRLPLTDSGENNDQVTVINLPFMFKMYGQHYTQASVSSNGWLSLGVTEQANFRNLPLPGPLAPRPLIAPYWDDLYISGTVSGVYTYYDSNNHTFIVQWNQMLALGNNAQVTFQAILYDPTVYPTPYGDGPIKFQYKTFSAGIAGPYSEPDNFFSVGIQDHTASRGITYVDNNTYYPGASTLGNNKALYITVPIIQSQEAYVVYNACTVTSTGNQSINYNSSSNMSISINNIGSSNASNLTIKLRSLNPYITVLDSTASLASIPSGQSVTLNNEFSIQASENAPNINYTPMLITITDNAGHSWTSTFMLQINAPDLSLGNIVINDANGNNNGRLDPGETVTITVPILNNGRMSTEGGSLYIISTNPQASLTENNINIPAINASSNYPLSFTVTADANTPTGSLSNIGMLFSLGNYTAQLNYSLAIGLKIESFETGNFSAYPWVHSTSPWTIINNDAYDGTYSARSGVIGHNQSTSLTITDVAQSAGTIKFAFKVSSEVNYDFLYFYIDTVQQQRWAGSVDWNVVEYPVTAGSHTYEWRYVKDNSVVGGTDSAIIDKIIFPNAGGNNNNGAIAHLPQTSIDFGENASVRNLNIVNFGNQALTGQITLPNGFYYQTPGQSSFSFSINAQSNQTFAIHFSPIANISYDGQILITSNDPQHATMTVTVTAGTHATHFNKVWSGTAIQPMTFNISNISIDNLPIQIGDEIGIFDGTYCVGSTQITSLSNPIVTVICSKDNPDTPLIDGFTVNNPVSIKVWRLQNTTEYANAEVIVTYISGNSNFTADQTLEIQITVIGSIDQNISLTRGWNMFSLNVLMDDPSMNSVLQSLITNGTLVKVQNEAGLSFEYLSSVQEWINQIGNIQSTEGYNIKVNNNTTLSLNGVPIALPLNVPLTQGWNIVSYPFRFNQSAMTLLNGLISNNQLVKVLNESGMAIEYLPQIGWINQINQFVPGEAYSVKVNQNTSLNYTMPNMIATAKELNDYNKNQADAMQSAKKVKRQPVHFIKNWEGNGYQHHNFYIMNNEYLQSHLLAGDEIAIFDGTECVAQYTIVGGENVYSLTASMSDSEPVNGYISGHSFSIKVFTNGVEISDVPFTVTYGVDHFEAGASTLVEINQLSNLPDLLNPETKIQSIYPNPFNPSTNIKYSVKVEGPVEIEIFNVKGQKVRTLVSENKAPGHYQIVWNGNNDHNNSVASGMYFCKLKTQDKQIIRKMMMIK